MNTSKDTILVCGAAGFLGRHCVEVLSRSKKNVMGAGRGGEQLKTYPARASFIEGELADGTFVEELLQRVNPDRILFAAGPADVQRSLIDPVEDLKAQLLPLATLLWSASRVAHPPGVLLVSSAAVYGNARSVPVAETAPMEPVSPYGFHKVAQEQLLREFHQLYGLPVSVARVFSTYGPGIRHLAVWDIATRAIKGDLNVRGSGEETRDYLHVQDVSRSLALILERGEFRGEVTNVASGFETSISHLTSLIYRTLDIHAPPIMSGKPLPGSPIRWLADITRLQNLGFSQSIDLATGISETVEWIRRNA